MAKLADSDDGASGKQLSSKEHDLVERSNKKIKIGDVPDRVKDLVSPQNVSCKEKLMHVGYGKDDIMVDQDDSNCFSEDMNDWWDRLQKETDFVMQRGDLEMENSHRVDKCLEVDVYKEEYEAWCIPLRKSLVIKLMGKNMSLSFMRSSLEKLWRLKEPFQLLGLDNEFFVVSFHNREDLRFAYQEGPWMKVD